MSLLDTLRERVRPDPLPSPARGRRPPRGEVPDVTWWTAPVAGALAATGSWLALALPALVVWVATAHTTVGWGDALAVASAGWLQGHGVPVAVGEVGLSLVPLGLWLGALLLTARSARRMLDRAEDAAPGTTWAPLLRRQVVPGYLGGYLGFGVLAWLVTLAGPARPTPLGLPLVLLPPALALAWALVNRYNAGEEAGFVGRGLDRLPRWLPPAAVVGVRGAGAALALGLLVVVAAGIARWSTVSGLHAALAPGVLGGVVLTLGQLLVLPNLGLYAYAWLAGPGFQIADGGTVTLLGSHPGLMPLVPVLGALPSAGDWSHWLLLLLSAPVLLGAGLGWLACRSMARFASWRTTSGAALTAAVTAALCLTGLAVLGSGAAGVERLRAVGTPWWFGPVTLAELVAGAMLFVAGRQLLLWVRPHR